MEGWRAQQTVQQSILIAHWGSNHEGVTRKSHFRHCWYKCYSKADESSQRACGFCKRWMFDTAGHWCVSLFRHLYSVELSSSNILTHYAFGTLYWTSGLYKHKRTAATHILVIMISTECRSRKPYALPIQCVSYVGMTVSQMRTILNRVVSAMKERGMDINGVWR